MLAINQVCAERQLAKEVVLEAVENALISAYKRNFGSSAVITAKIDSETGAARVYAQKTVVEDVKDNKAQITLDEARAINPLVQMGEFVLIETTPKDFGRIAAQTAKQVILQRIREAERDQLFSQYVDREGEIVTGTVQSLDSQVVIINLGKAEGTLPRSEQIPGERYQLNSRIKAYVVEVDKAARGPRIILSRSHRNMLRRLLELEVPEIFNGAVEIKAIAREAGSRSKVAVAALKPGVDPVGSCVGMRGTRIQGIVDELHGEKIDVVEWKPEITEFISNALSPARVITVRLEDNLDGKTATVIVPDTQLSLAIGKEGQNARLAAKLTGWRIDIKSATEAADQVFSMSMPAPQPVAAGGEDLLARAEAMLAAKTDEATDMEHEEKLAELAGISQIAAQAEPPAPEPQPEPAVEAPIEAEPRPVVVAEPAVVPTVGEIPAELGELVEWVEETAAEGDEEEGDGKGKAKKKDKPWRAAKGAEPLADDFDGLGKRKRKPARGRGDWE
jgi:N utilization substance protein A